MRVLFLSHLVPYPLDAGAKIRSYYVLRHLVGAGHAVTLCAFSRASDDRVALQHVQTLCPHTERVPITRSISRDVWSFVRSSVAGTSFTMERDRVAEMHARVAQLATASPGFDIIHADQLAMAPYAVTASQACRGTRSPALVLDQHNAMFNVVRRLAAADGRSVPRRLLSWEADKLARQEVALCSRFDHLVWVADHDRDAVASGIGSAINSLSLDRSSTGLDGIPSTVIPIAIDPGRDAPVTRSPGAKHVLFLGGLHWPPNHRGIVRFLERAWPRVRETRPDACLTIIGRNPPPTLVREGRRRSDLHVPGYVSDPREYLEKTAAFIVPLDAGGGMRVKILNAWAWGLPVVSTSIGAEGLRARDGENCLLADSMDELAMAVVSLLEDPERGGRLARAGRRTLEEHYDWRTAYTAWDAVYDDLADRGTGSR